MKLLNTKRKEKQIGLLNSLNNKGSALIGALVASAIGLIVILGTTESLLVSTKMSRRVADSSDLNWLLNRANIKLSEWANDKKLDPANEHTFTFPSPSTKGVVKISVATNNYEACFEAIKKAVPIPENLENKYEWVNLIDGTEANNKFIIAKTGTTESAFERELLSASGLCEGEVLVGESVECYEVNDDTPTNKRQSLVGCGIGTTDKTARPRESTFFGFEAGSKTTGFRNTFMGYQSGKENTGGQYNTFLGYQAGLSNIGESTYTSYFSNPYGSGLTLNQVLSGKTSDSYNKQGSGNVYVGRFAGRDNVTGSLNTFIGEGSGEKSTQGYGNTFLGFKSGFQNTNNKNTFIGAFSGLENINGKENSFFGFQAGFKNDTGYNNVFVGSHAGSGNKSGYNNTAIGFKSGLKNKAGTGNTYIGHFAGRNNDKSSNVFIGEGSGRSNTGTSNTFVGYRAGGMGSLGDYNFFGGKSAGHSNTGHNNIFIGNNTGKNNLEANNNTFIGSEAGHSHKTGNNNIYIGRQAGCDDYRRASVDYCVLSKENIYIGATYKPTTVTDTLSNKLNIGNLIVGNGLRIDNELNSYRYPESTAGVQINGKLFVTGDLEVTGAIRSTLGAVTSIPSSSDKRLKKNIKPLSNSLTKLLKLKPSSYYWKDKSRSKRKKVGLIAQEVKPLFPELVYEGKDKKKLLSLDYISLAPFIIQAFKEFYHSVTKTLANVITELSKVKMTLLKTEKKMYKELSTLKEENEYLKTTLDIVLERIERLETKKP